MIWGIFRLQLGLWRGQFASYDSVLEASFIVRTVAEGLIGRVAAAAEANRRASGQAEGGALRIHDLKVAFHADTTVVANGDFRRSHVRP
jgi:hypothetical protein